MYSPSNTPPCFLMLGFIHRIKWGSALLNLVIRSESEFCKINNKVGESAFHKIDYYLLHLEQAELRLAHTGVYKVARFG